MSKMPAASVREGHPAGHSHAFVEEKLLHLLDELITRQIPVALHLNVDLIHL